MSDLVQFSNNGDVRLNIGSVPEAKLAIKELKLRKKELNAEKKVLISRIAEIRAQYRQDSAKKGSMMRGGGGFGKFVRMFQRADRDSARSNKENAITPYEQKKMQIERMIAVVDDAVLKVEKYILEQTGK